MFKNKLETVKAAVRTKRLYGKGYNAQLKDILRLRKSFAPLCASEYYEFRLYDDERYPSGEKDKFLGYRGRRIIDDALNDKTWNVIHSDKIVMWLLFRQLGVPCPQIYAAYDSWRRRIPGIDYATDKDELCLLLKRITYPVFLKPVDAGSGRGALLITGFSTDGETIELHGGQKLTVDDLHQKLDAEARRGRGGYLFQEVVRSGAEAAAFTGGRLVGLRLVVLNYPSAPVLVHAVVKFPTGENIIDNIHGEAKGNLLGGVNIETGAVEKVFRFNTDRYEQLTRHPDSNNPFSAFSIPDWERCKRIVLDASAAFPALRLQHWDIQIGNSGPLAVEVNTHGALDLPQIANERGFFDGLCREAYLALAPKKGRGPLWGSLAAATAWLRA